MGHTDVKQPLVLTRNLEGSLLPRYGTKRILCNRFRGQVYVYLMVYCSRIQSMQDNVQRAAYSSAKAEPTLGVLHIGID